MRPAFLTELTARPPEWLGITDEESAVVLSSRIRLARNLRDFRFPGKASERERLAICQTVGEAAAAGALGDPVHFVDLPGADETTRLILAERQLISRAMCAAGPGCGVCVGGDTRLGVVVNEEDHLRLQGLHPGLEFEPLWRDLEVADDQLCARLPFAFDKRLGFLTACPSNVGTGMRVSAMMWLPGLVISRQMKQVIAGAHALGLTVRGTFGEGTEALGHVFQVSNQSTLGESESGIIFRVESVVRHLANCERSARSLLLGDPDHSLGDLVGRAYGVLRHARQLSSNEAIGALFAVRLGVVTGLFERLDLATVNRLIIAVQRGHMALEHADVKTSGRRRILRARLVRDELRQHE